MLRPLAGAGVPASRRCSPPAQAHMPGLLKRAPSPLGDQAQANRRDRPSGQAMRGSHPAGDLLACVMRHECDYAPSPSLQTVVVLSLLNIIAALVVARELDWDMPGTPRLDPHVQVYLTVIRQAIFRLR
jgi:hypothetical protein